MKYPKLTLIVLTLVSTLLVFAPIRDAKILPSISNLSKDEKIEVEFRSFFCFVDLYDFSHNSNIFTFEHDHVTIYALKTGWSETENKRIHLGKTKLGERELQEADTKGLDKLFAFYASGPSSGCTTINWITVKLFRNNTLVDVKNFTDGSCETDGMKDVLTLEALRSPFVPPPSRGQF